MSAHPQTLRYQRVLLKLSGEALQSTAEHIICPQRLHHFASEIKAAVSIGAQIGVVIGAGNMIRGQSSKHLPIQRTTCDTMGMLATCINALALRDALRELDCPATCQSSIAEPNMLPAFNQDDADRLLSEGQVVIFAGGTGNPLFTTDTNGSLRAIQIRADILLKATQVGAIYDDDPKTNPAAKILPQISYQYAIQHNLKIMDITAFHQCQEHQLPIRVFDALEEGALCDILHGQVIGTLVCHQGDDNDK